MTTTRSGSLLRSLPVLFALALAFLMQPATVNTTNTGSAAPAASSHVIASIDDREPDDRTAAASPAETTGDAAAEPLTTTHAVADRARALTTQRTAGAAASRAPPFTA